MSAAPDLFAPNCWGGLGRIRYYAGYSWTTPEVVKPFSRGQVATPRWAKRVKGPLMLDNGAWPAFRDGVELPFSKQVAAMAPFIERAEWIIAPDKVAAGEESWVRTRRALALWHEHAHKMLLPVQEGADLSEVVAWGRHAGGLFVGGSTYDWKIAVSKMLRGLGFEGVIHVGRIARPQHLSALSGVADSIDNTTWVRAQNYNKALPLAALLRQYIEPRAADNKGTP